MFNFEIKYNQIKYKMINAAICKGLTDMYHYLC